MSQSDTENDKNARNFQFSKILCLFFFLQNFDNFVDWNVEKGQQGKNVLSSRFSWRVYCSFLSDYVSNWNRKYQITENFLVFKAFIHLLKFRQTSLIKLF